MTARPGPAGPPGGTGGTGPTGPTGPGLDPIASAKPESCLTCHREQGVDHQNVYRDYLDAKTKSKFQMNLTSLTAAPSATAGKYDVTLAFNVKKVDANGVNFIPYDEPGLASLDQKRFTVQGYFPGEPVFKFQGAYTTGLSSITSLGSGNYTASAKAVSYDPTTLVGLAGLRLHRRECARGPRALPSMPTWPMMA